MFMPINTLTKPAPKLEPRTQTKPTPAVSKNLLKIIPLGGLGEYGKNMMVIEYGSDILVVDCGIMFPGEEMLGIDFVIPDIRYLEGKQNQIRGILITHGHEDHIGALPYLWPKLKAPIYTTKLTAGLIEVKMREFSLGQTRINIIRAGDKIKMGVFEVEFFGINHSIPDNVGLAITTPAGLIVHTSDFKIDYTPVNDQPLDLSKLAEFGKKGVLVLMSDSTNSEVPGYTVSEKVVGETIDQIIANASGRVIIACFASLINRIQQVLNAAKRHNRKVAIAGRSLLNNIEITSKLGYLKIPRDLIVDVRKIHHSPDDQQVLLVTGSQGEERSALVLMAGGEHRQIKLRAGDTVAISASMIPGNERSVYDTIDNLYRQGVQVIHGRQADILNIHTSGHASIEELKMILELTRPKYFIPIHGAYHHLINHAKIACDLGIAPKNIFVIENGQKIEVTHQGVQIAKGRVPSGYILVDGLGVGDVGNIVLRDRQAMAKEGILVAIMTVDARTGKLITSPDIISRGFIYMREREDLVHRTRDQIKNLLARYNEQHRGNWELIKTLVREELGQFLYNETERRPLILPVVIEV